ncbi:MAG: M48 family metalloprotease [Sneathiella sp.]|nr:M48 family metalloprotease [Sneathiella sp.]
MVCTKRDKKYCGLLSLFRGRLIATSLLALSLVPVSTPASADVMDDLFSIFEPSNERETGAEQHPKILAQFGGEYVKEGLNDYILDIGLRLAFVSEMKTLPWRFTILNTPVINAFALLGGYVYITRGLLALANNEAQVAGVLAHEIGHVTARHGAARQSRATGIGLLGTLAGILTGSAVVQELGQQLGGLYVASYSRDQEYEADQLGVKYLGLAGYPREAMADFLKLMQAQTEYTQKLAGNNGNASQFDFFASHPQTEERVGRAAEAAAANSDNLDRENGQARYFKAINGMLYGDDPKEGIIRGREFLHPVLRFKFDAPEGFQLINSSSAVYATDGKGSQMVFDIGKPKNTGLSMTAYMKQEWLVKINPPGIRAIEVGGAPAAVTSVAVEKNGNKLYLTAVAIDFGGDQVARFIYQSTSITQDLQTRIEQSYRSFRPLQADEANEIKPTVIAIETVKSGSKLSALVQGMADAAVDKEALFLLLNPEFKSGTPIAGKEYKSLRYAD